MTRDGSSGREVLLVHARGASFRLPLFGIPKGVAEEGETLEETALRETLEETGLRVDIRSPLGSVRQKSGKVVHAFWATVAPSSASEIDDKGRCRCADGENDVCRFYAVDEARKIMIPAQRELLDRLPAADSDS